MSLPLQYHVRLGLAAAFIMGALGGILAAPFTYRFVSQEELVFPSDRGVRSGVMQQSRLVDEETATMRVVDATNGAVVSIAIYKDISSFPQNISLPLDDFFGMNLPFRFEPEPVAPRTKTSSTSTVEQVGGGSGFIIQPNGLIVTNRHVVDDEDATYRVVLADGTEYPADVIAKDPVLDVALIKIDAKKDLPTLHLGDSDRLKPGQTVIAIGNALSEFGNTVTRGVVSGIGRRVEAGNSMGTTEVLDEAIQTDAAINPGNSGGPLLNIAGEVVGVNTAVSVQGQSLGFAIPINSLKKTIESVQKTGRIIRPWLGVRYIPVTPRLAEMNKLSVTYGALVSPGQTIEEVAVIPGSPADKAGIVENDIILSINGKKLDEKDSLAKHISQYNVGEKVTLTILHKGKEKTITLTLEEFKSL